MDRAILNINKVSIGTEREYQIASQNTILSPRKDSHIGPGTADIPTLENQMNQKVRVTSAQYKTKPVTRPSVLFRGKYAKKRLVHDEINTISYAKGWVEDRLRFPKTPCKDSLGEMGPEDDSGPKQRPG